MVHSELLTSFSGTSEQRIQAIFHCLFDKSDEAISTISYTLKNDPSPIVRHEAAYILGEKNTILAVTPLSEAIRNDPHKIVVHESLLALANLGKIGYPDSKKVIEEQLNNKDEDVADTAEIAFQRLQMKLQNDTLKEDLHFIKQVLEDKRKENKERRIQSSFILMEKASTEAVDLLITALGDEPSPIVKHELIFSLGECIHYNVVPVLINLLHNETNFFTIHESLLALGTIGNMKAEQEIKKFLGHSDPEIVESAEIGLERLYS